LVISQTVRQDVIDGLTRFKVVPDIVYGDPDARQLFFEEANRIMAEQKQADV
jgi:hypothetical protein